VASSNQSSPRTRTQIEADLAATRSRLTGSLETLIDQVHPNRVKQRTIASVKATVAEQVENARYFVFNARGDLRKDRLMKVGAAVAGALAFVLIVRAARHGSSD
jgi:hypothetical protein